MDDFVYQVKVLVVLIVSLVAELLHTLLHTQGIVDFKRQLNGEWWIGD